MRHNLAEELAQKCAGVVPDSRSDWRGRIESFDGTSCADFSGEDIAEIIAASSTDAEWEGEVAAVFKLSDGRYVAFETYWGPTGNGFCSDAYGGDANICVGATVESVIKFGLTDEGRLLLKLTLE